MPSVELRTAVTADAAFIVEMARHACVIEDRPLPDAEEARSLLPTADDVIVVAADHEGVHLGAAWTFHHDPPLLIDARGIGLPEVAMAVVSARRGEGLGGMLLDLLIARCAGTCDALCLNVHDRNPAAHLYRRKGFEVTGRGRGALGTAMRLALR